jgi:uncharacterized phage protein gp47/JayE
MATEPTLPVIDYTSRDYLSLRDDLCNVIRMRLPNWEGTNPSDFGLALVEAYAYGLDTLHYYIDRVANEAYLPTAVQRESLYSIAEMFNYTPRAAVPATVELEFANTSATEVTLPAGSMCRATIPSGDSSITLNFETNEALTLPPTLPSGPTPDRVWATEGRTYKDETLGTSSGFVAQQFVLAKTSVLPYTVNISTELKASSGVGGSTGSSVLEWSEIDDLKNAYPNSRVFQVLRQTDGSSIVRFGDGFHGSIPDAHSVIRATYRVGGGSDGNVSASTITTLVTPAIQGVTVTNPAAATGGVNQESLSSIRINAARSFRSRDRAVTLTDYVAVTESAPSIAKAKAVGNNGSSVTVYVVPEADEFITRDATTQEIRTTFDDTLRKNTIAYLEARAMAGVTVSVTEPEWIEVFFKMTAYCLPSFYQDAVKKEIRDRLTAYFDFQRLTFDSVVSANSIYDAVFGVQGLSHLEVVGFGLDNNFDNNTTTDTIYLNTRAVGAMQYYRDASSLNITMSGGISASA